MRRVTEILADGEMQFDRIRLKMQISDSGCRKYLYDLQDGGIVEMMGRAPSKTKLPGQPIYKLVADAEKIDEYLDSAAGITRKPKKVDRFAGRFFHILADDAHFAIKVLNVLPTHDPLHAAFWAGRVGA
jgi:transcription initiation factor IIE alpha subunit